MPVIILKHGVKIESDSGGCPGHGADGFTCIRCAKSRATIRDSSRLQIRLGLGRQGWVLLRGSHLRRKSKGVFPLPGARVWLAALLVAPLTARLGLL
jgi:hypothetical protein